MNDAAGRSPDEAVLRGEDETATRGGEDEAATRGGEEETATRGGGEETATRGGEEETAIRGELARWITANWDPALSLRRWRELLADSGWACPAWPLEWCGRGLAPALARTIVADLAEASVPGPPEGLGMMLAAPVLLEHGSHELKRQFIRRTVTGEITWCQLFSEPGAGSDLAGLSTRAVRDGDGWLVTGQKVWSTGAATADFGLLLARTDPDVPKHQGISAFVLPMRQAGVQVRPLRQMNGHRSFNEVFFDGARVPPDYLIGEPGGGWRVARATLAHERRLAVFRTETPRAEGRAWREAVAERTAAAEPHKWYPQRAGRPDLVIPRAKAQGVAADPVHRQADRVDLVGALDGGAGRGEPGGGAAARTGRLARQAGQQPDRSARGPGAHHDRRRVRPAGRARVGAGRDHRGDPGFGPRHLDRGRHRRDPAHDHRRADARPAARAGPQQEHAVQGHAKELTRWPTSAGTACGSTTS